MTETPLKHPSIKAATEHHRRGEPMCAACFERCPHRTTSGYDNWACRCDLCKEAKVISHREHYKENREAIAEQTRKYREENREAIAERARKYREENREVVAEYQRKYYYEGGGYFKQIQSRNGAL